MKTLLGFHSTELGPHIQRAYQALALDERRADFVCIDLLLSDWALLTPR